MANTFVGLDAPSMQWIIEDEVGVVNTKFGYVRVVRVIDMDSGAFRYEGIIFAEAKGVINIIVNVDDPDNPRIAFVTQVRHAVIDPQYLNDIWDSGVPNVLDSAVKEHMGVLVTELPRGFTPGKDILSEAEEETKRKVEFVARIGNVNANTANTATSPQVLVALATRLSSDRRQSEDEKIREVLWLTPREILEKVELCGFTMACLFMFRQWCLNNEKQAWKAIGEKL